MTLTQIRQAHRAAIQIFSGEYDEAVARPWGVDVRGNNQGYTIDCGSYDEASELCQVVTNLVSTLRRTFKNLKEG